jgi:hypothetical protein
MQQAEIKCCIQTVVTETTTKASIPGKAEYMTTRKTPILGERKVLRNISILDTASNNIYIKKHFRTK